LLLGVYLGVYVAFRRILIRVVVCRRILAAQGLIHKYMLQVEIVAPVVIAEAPYAKVLKALD